jgi:hypothetical protein
MPVARVPNLWALFLVAGCVVVSPVLAADEASWKNKLMERWTEEDAKQVLTDSPWVKKTQLQIVRDLSPDERRASGNMEADIGKGVGLAGIGILGPTRQVEAIARAHEKPDPGKVMVRWESARPVHAAEVKLGDMQAPAIGGEYYGIVVNDVPTPNRWNIERELRGIAALKRYQEKDLKPSRVVIVRKDDAELANVIYLFPRSVEITKKDPYVGFWAQIGRLVVWQVFSPQEMQIQGQLEL